MVGQIPPHRPACYGEEMLPIVPMPVFRPNRTQVNLVNEFGRLECMALAHMVVSRPIPVKVKD